MKETVKTTTAGRRNRKAGIRRAVVLLSIAIAAITVSISSLSDAAEIYISRAGVRQLNFLNLTDGGMNDLRNDPVPDFNWYISRWDARNPIEWSHKWSLAIPSAGNIALDPDEAVSGVLAAEIFPVVWDIDYPSSTEDDELYWDKIPYSGGVGGAFSLAANPAAIHVARLQGNNNYWGAKRVSLNPNLIPQNQTQYFWMQVDVDPAMPDWKSSIDYSDLAIIFNPGTLAISKLASHVSGFDPPRVGYATKYRVRINIGNPTMTSAAGPMYDVKVTDKFPAGSTILASPALGSASIDAAGNLTWNVGILQDGALNTPPAAGSMDSMDVLVTVMPTQAQVGTALLMNNGATIIGGQTPLDPGDGTGVLYPFNFHGSMADITTAVSVTVFTPNTDAAHTGTLVTTPNIRPGSPVTITVADEDLNTNTAVVDTVAIPIVNTTTGETETVTCTETGPNTGIFTTAMPTIYGTTAGANNNGTMTAQAGDTLRATYNDLVNAGGNPALITSNTAVGGGTAGTINSTTPIFPTAVVTLTLSDADLNTNPAAIEIVQLLTVNTRTGEQELLTYTEAGPNTGVFTSTLNTAISPAAAANNDGAMNCISGDTLATTYNDALTASGGNAVATANTIVIGGSAGTLTSDTAVLPGHSFNVTLVDSDLNTNPAAPDSITLTLTNTSTGEIENIIFTEAGTNTGIFSAVVNTVFGAARGTDNDGVFAVQAGNIISATYNDALTLTGGTAVITATTSVVGGGDSTLTATPSILPGANVSLTLSDADLNTNSSAAETVMLPMSNTPTNETEQITFTETGPNTGIFTAKALTTFNTAPGANNDGTFNVQAGQSLSITYNDALTHNGSAASLTATTQVLGGSNGTIASTASILPGGTITFTVSDADLNTNPAVAQIIIIAARNTVTNEVENVTLTETGPATGIFTGTFPTRFFPAAGANNDGVFNVTGAQTITANYNDALTASGGGATINAVTAVVDDSNSVTITGPIGAKTTATQNVAGTTDPFSSLSMKDPVTGGLLTATADVAGNFTFPNVVFSEGVTTFTVTSTDPAGNKAVDAATVLIDTRNSITVTSPMPGSTITTLKTDVSGITDPGATITLIEPATGNVLTQTADSNGIFTFKDVMLADGNNTLQFTSTDTHGNTAAITTTVLVDPDITLSITSITGGATINNSQIEIAGKTDPSATVTTMNPMTGAIVTATADANGDYSFGVMTFTDGPHSVTVNATDPAGNTASSTVSFTVDTTNTNDIITAGLFTTSTINITGDTSPFSTVTMPNPLSGQTLIAIADASGRYTFPNVYFPDGSYTITTTSRDTAGNIAVDSSNITVDGTIGLTVFLPPDRSVVTANILNIRGVTDPFATVSMTDPATDVPLRVTADGGGNFAFNGVHLNDGANTMTIIAVDPSGNSASYNHTLIYDPNIGLSIITPANGSIVRTEIQTVSGFTTPGATVTMTHPQTGLPLTTTADATGGYKFLNIPFNSGRNTVTVTASDQQGHTASASNTFIVANTGVDAELQASERVVFGHPIMLQVTDAESYLSSTAIDIVNVIVTDPSTGDSEVRSLVETAPDSGVFTGILNTGEASSSDGLNSGYLAVRYGDVVTTTYIDAINADSSLNVPLTSRTLVTNDEIVIRVNVMAVGGTVSVQPLSLRRIGIIEFDAAGMLTGNVINYTTDQDGAIPSDFIGVMRSGYSYQVLLNETLYGFPYSHSSSFRIEDLTRISPDSRGVRTMVVLLDPAGYIYDSVTGARINGADVTLRHSDGRSARGPLSFYTRRPSLSQTNPQLSGDSGVSGGFEFISDASTDFTSGDYYIMVTYDTNPALGGTYFPVTLNNSSWSGIQQPYAGQLFRVDSTNQPIGMRIPLMPRNLATPLSIDKKSNKDAASLGDIITFTVTVRNLSANSTDPDHPVAVFDTLPVGLTYIKGSAVLINGTPVTAIQFGGGKIYFTLKRLEPAGDPNGNDVVTFHYQATVDTSTRPGIFVTNSAVAMINMLALSNTGSVTVKIIFDPLLDQATIIGKVFIDENRNGVQDDAEKGAKNVGILLDDGTYVLTDAEGKYSVPGAQPGMETSGMRAIKIDMNTLPAEAELTTPASQFVTLRPGGIDKANFGYYLSGDKASNASAHYNNKLFIVSFDAAAGEVVSGSKGLTRPDIDILPEGGYTKSRLAFFFRGAISSRFSLTTAYDSHKRHTTDISPDLDRDKYYPTYGDNSRLSYLANTQGKFFLELKSLSSKLLVGNYSAQFSDTELAGIQRSLSGMKFDFNKISTSAEKKPATMLTAFTAKRSQLQARNEFRATGGTIYHLAHSRIVPGSENITVEIRDALIPEKSVSTRMLTRDIDYEVDYLTGGIRLFSPIASFAENNYLNADGIGSGNPIWVVVEYMYEPDRAEYGLFGGRLLRRTADGFETGASYLRENIEGRDHVLKAIDLHWKPGNEDLAKIEVARSESGGVPRLASLDAGGSFIAVGGNNSNAGSAVKLYLKITSIKNLDWENYFYSVDPEFEGGDYSDRGIRRSGTSLKYSLGKRTLALDYTNAVSLADASRLAFMNAGAGATRALRLAYRRELVKAHYEIEMLHRNNAAAVSVFGAAPGTTDSLAVKYEREVTDRLVVAVRQQFSLSPRDNYQSALSAKYKMRKGFNVIAETTFGTFGAGYKLGFEKENTNGSKTYMNFSTGYSPEAGADRSCMTAGVSGKVGKNASAYAEYETASQANESIMRHVIGLNQKYDMGGGTLLSMSIERSMESSSLQGRYFTNSINLSAEHTTAAGIRLTGESEFRSQKGSIDKNFFSYHFTAEGEARKNLHGFFEYAYDVSDDILARRAESKYTKALFGLAWRPSDNDRLNVLAKAARIREFRSQALNDSLNPDTISTVLSLEGIYELSKKFLINEKIASKAINETLAPLPRARTHTTLWINGITWRPAKRFDLRAEFRAAHQPTGLNHHDGASVEAGYTFREQIRIGAGYNFSSFSDDEFATSDNSYRGVFFRLQGKF